MYSLPDECTAVEEDRCFIVLFVRLPVSLGVWNSKVLLAGGDELFSELLLEGGIFSVHIGVLRHVISVLDLVLLRLEEPAEVVLQGALLRAAKDE